MWLDEQGGGEKKIAPKATKKRKGGGSRDASHCARSASDLEPGLLRREAPRRRRRFHCRTREEGLVGRRSITFKARSNPSTELIERDAPTLSYNDSSFALKGRGSEYFVIVLLVVVLQLSLSNVMWFERRQFTGCGEAWGASGELCTSSLVTPLSKSEKISCMQVYAKQQELLKV